MDVQELMNENMKLLMKEMAVSIRNNIVDTMKTQRTIKETTNVTPISPTELITQSSHRTPQVEELNNLIYNMDIEKSPNKRKAPTPFNENENQEEEKESPTQHGKTKKEPQLESRD